MHFAIIVTAVEPQFSAAAEKATGLGFIVACQDGASFNGYRTLVICADGTTDDLRGEFKRWLSMRREELGFGAYDWFEATYGTSGHPAFGEATITDSAWAARFINLVTPSHEPVGI